MAADSGAAIGQSLGAAGVAGVTELLVAVVCGEHCPPHLLLINQRAAGNRCEYCCFPKKQLSVAFEMEHIDEVVLFIV
ncbi:hypothetical protein H6F75_16505 [Nodosilinea sp. FACHB-131]|uniref:hypothetical protein n=1 Tax=Cyanophyceae TaxID=3028117 RepID=UPI001684001E|nr:hypothetical protein [Nodosilinea sp. FACHB-131]MBD1875088.1 hypothetical protein [Nodosilinea sp. FACHB-131]